MTTNTRFPLSKAATNAHPPRFDGTALRNVAGEAAFTRGLAYFEDKRVELVRIEEARVLAKVSGSEVYRCELEGAGADFSGECSCPAFSDRGFCKHLVATALAANDLRQGRPEQADNRFTRIRDHLRARGVEPLVEMIMDLAEHDPTLLEDLELAAAEAWTDDETLFARFKAAITQATRTHGYVEYREVRAWAERVEGILRRIESLIGGGRSTMVLRLLDHFFARMDKALDSLDDSGGGAGGVYAKGREIHLAACREARPDPVALAGMLFAREVDSDWDFFHGAGEAYADILGEAGLTEYRRLAEEGWQKIKPRAAIRRDVPDEEDGDRRYRLAAILDRFAERDGDVDSRVAIRAKDLSSSYAYLGIAQLCLDHGRETEALRWAEDGLWQFEDHPDERLIFFAADLYRRSGRGQAADGLLWRTFDRLPSMELYRRLKAIAGPDRAMADSVRDRALASLRSQIRGSGQHAAARWSSPVELLLQLMMMEGLLGQAWDVARVHGASDRILESLAEASEDSHPAEALAAYADRVARLVGFGGQGNYDGACRIIGRMRVIRERLGQRADHAAFLDDLMIRHKAKRNFIKALWASGDS